MRTAVLLCASLAAPALAWAQDATPFVTQLRLPAREAVRDVMAWRTAGGIAVARADLEALDIVVPADAGERIDLGAIPGLSFSEHAADVAIVLDCRGACLAPQRLQTTSARPALDRASGAYLNYDIEAQWLDGQSARASSILEAAAFGGWGLIESSAVALAGGEDRITRLETRWTIDDPARRLRFRIGDATFVGAAEAPMRFAGIQIGRHFGLEPSFVTYPTALIGGEAGAASTVELYVDGALRAREQVAAGPFVFDNAPLVSGGGQAQIVITDVAGRQQIISRSFFVSSALLRPGLSDWAVSIGAERLAFGADDAAYGDDFAAARYRLGLTRALTAEAALDLSGARSVGQAGVTFADARIGQLRASYARGEDGGASTLSWFQDADSWSIGVQGDQRDAGFRALGLGESTLRQSLAGHLSIEFGAAGYATLTAASVEFDSHEDARTVTLSYSPRLDGASLSARIVYTEREENDLAFALTLTTALSGDVSASAGYGEDRHGPTYRAALQRAPDYEGGLGWRVRAIEGRRSYAEAALSRRGGLGDSVVQIARSDGVTGVRAGHGGSLGVIDGHVFAAPPVRGGFALVDAGASGVLVLRDRFPAGITGLRGRTVITGLRPYEANAIAIRADDLPFDRTPSQTELSATPAEGAGVIVRFDRETERLQESRVVFADASPPPRGAVLVRPRDGARFPIGAQGRIVLRGARSGDIVHLDLDARCTARADEAAADHGLTLVCTTA